MNLTRLGKITCSVFSACFLVYIGAYADLWSSLESYSPVFLADDPILLVLNATFAPKDNLTDDLYNTSAIGTFTAQNVSLPFCNVTPPNLVGPIKVWLDEPDMTSIEKLYPDLEEGGHGQPEKCKARHKVAIIAPYRDREVHLRILLHNLHSLLKKQEVDYAIFVVEQIENQTFNRAKLMNVGFVEALKVYDWQCFIFHDVDLLPEDDRNLYTCPEQPRHMSVAIDKFKYKLPYSSLFGGISAMTKQQVEKINGFSNDYWGWGGEDDDLSTRVTSSGYKIMRYPAEIARYKMVKHTKEKSNPVNTCRYTLMKRTKSRYRRDGLSNLNYKVIDVERKHLYTHIKVDLLEKESRDKLHGEQRIFKKC
uniref:Beta-1,4-N-acetylgalactosaminyltransferase n=1 Tax=Panagrolaimus sp. JU765 TaxID=591449 RepID=A0AC34R983_9BILA